MDRAVLHRRRVNDSLASRRESLGTYQSSDTIVSALVPELQIQDGRQHVIFNSPFVDDLEDRTVLITAIFLVHSFRSAPPALIAAGIALALTMQQPDRYGA